MIDDFDPYDLIVELTASNKEAHSLLTSIVQHIRHQDQKLQVLNQKITVLEQILANMEYPNDIE